MIQKPALNAVDHLLLGAGDLDQGIAWLEARAGVKAAFGGVHPGRGTRNALASLGPSAPLRTGGRQYLEIIAPDPAQATFEFHIDLRTLREPRLVTWAAATDDVERVAAAARAAGFAVSGPRDGARSTPSGSLLRWRTVAVDGGLGGDGVEPLPFFIQWAADTSHPSADAPSGLRLIGFELKHPRPEKLQAALARLGIDAPVRSAASASLSATLDTPAGTTAL